MDKELKILRQMSHREFVATMQSFGNMTVADLSSESQRPTRTVFEVLLAKTLLEAVRGDADARRTVFDRMWGKVRDVVAIETELVDKHLEKIPRDAISRLLREYK